MHVDPVIAVLLKFYFIMILLLEVEDVHSAHDRYI